MVMVFEIRDIIVNLANCSIFENVIWKYISDKVEYGYVDPVSLKPAAPTALAPARRVFRVKQYIS